jgi:signal transduction histidine kinase
MAAGQEGISGAVRHAPGAPIKVVVRRVADELRVTVSNAKGGSTTKSGAGQGLLGSETPKR